MTLRLSNEILSAMRAARHQQCVSGLISGKQGRNARTDKEELNNSKAVSGLFSQKEGRNRKREMRGEKKENASAQQCINVTLRPTALRVVYTSPLPTIEKITSLHIKKLFCIFGSI